MARYQPRVNIWEVPEGERHKRLQPGQHVSAGDARGVFLGGTERTCVVAWAGNAKGRYREYLGALRDYAKGLAA